MKNRKKKRFTLIELLVVIAVIAILMGILLPAIGSVRQKGKITKAKAEANAIVTAVKAYEQTYGLLPIVSTMTTSDKMDETEYNKLIECLSYVDGPDSGSTITNDPVNPRQIRFLDVPSTYGSSQGYLDPWGVYYRVCIDRDYDGQVSTGTFTLNGSVFVYSAGPNKADNNGRNKQFGDGTNYDDVDSWR